MSRAFAFCVRDVDGRVIEHDDVLAPAKMHKAVIASEAKQSIHLLCRAMDCFASLAMTMELRSQLLSTSPAAPRPAAPRRYARKDAEAKFARKNFLHHFH
jgi:hypothetical protein